MKNARIAAAFFVTLSVLSLTGCNGEKFALIEKNVLKQIGDDENYREYLELKEAGQLDEDGNYNMGAMLSEESADSEIVPGDGDICVSIGKNPFLDIVCRLSDGAEFRDKCNINAGDTLYVDKPQLKSSGSSTYHFDRFRINANDGFEFKAKFEETPDGGYKLTIPEDYRGNSLTVLPLGKYEDRVVKCRVFIKSGETEEQSNEGIWSWGLYDEDLHFTRVNNNNCTELIFSPTASYMVRFTYNRDIYCVESCSDKEVTVDSDSSVVFPVMNPSDPTKEYSVTLKRLVNVKFEGKEFIKSITVDGEETELEDGELKRLNSDSKVEITLKRGFVLADSDSFGSGEQDTNHRMVYTFKFPEKIPDNNQMTVTVERSLEAVPGGYMMVMLGTDEDNKLGTFSECRVDGESVEIIDDCVMVSENSKKLEVKFTLKEDVREYKYISGKAFDFTHKCFETEKSIKTKSIMTDTDKIISLDELGITVKDKKKD